MATKKATSRVSKKTSPKKTAQPKEVISSELTPTAARKKTPVLANSRIIYVGLVLLFGLALILFYGSKFLVVAWVDKKPITRVEYYQNLDSKYGKDLREQLIVEKLIIDEAQNKGLMVTDADVSAEIKKFETEQGGADKVNQLLQLQGLTRNELTKLVRLQLLKQKIFGANVTINDDEINKYIADNKDQFPQASLDDASASAKLKANVKQQLMQQKINNSFSQWVQQTLQSSRVVRINP